MRTTMKKGMIVIAPEAAAAAAAAFGWHTFGSERQSPLRFRPLAHSDTDARGPVGRT